jgi:hypothetical protein
MLWFGLGAAGAGGVAEGAAVGVWADSSVAPAIVAKRALTRKKEQFMKGSGNAKYMAPGPALSFP